MKNYPLRVFPLSHYLLLAALFFVGLELIVAFHQWLLAVTAILLAIVGYGIFLVRYEEGGRFRLVQIILPTLAAAGFTGLAFFLPRTQLLHAYFLVASFLFYGLLRHGARQAYPTWNWMISTLVLCVDIAVILGIRWHLYTSILATLFAVFIVVFLLSWQALFRLIGEARKTIVLSAALALVMVECAWALQFLPLFFLIQAGLVASFYYVFFYCVALSLQGLLTRRRLLEYGGLGVGATLILLLSARWL